MTSRLRTTPLLRLTLALFTNCMEGTDSLRLTGAILVDRCTEPVTAEFGGRMLKSEAWTRSVVFFTQIILVVFTLVDPFQGHSNTPTHPPTPHHYHQKRHPELYFFVSCCLSKFKLCMAILWSGLYFECCFVMGLHAERLVD